MEKINHALQNARSAGLIAVVVCCVFSLSQAVFAQAPGASQASPVQSPTSAVQLVREMVQAEIAAQKQDHSRWSYQELKQTDKKPEELRDVVETSQGTIYRIMTEAGRPLTPAEQKKESARLAKLSADPNEIEKNRRAADADAKNERSLMKMLPTAFLYQYVGTDGDLIKLTFQPNPDFHAPNHMAEVFHHMQGTMWIDGKQHRLARLEGRITSEVKFGYGFLGHLDQGGTFIVKQAEVGPNHWDLVQLDVHMTGRELFFKTIDVREREQCSNYQRVPNDMTIQQAAARLQKTTVSALNTHVSPAS